jgi:hypothetical protein
MMTLAFPIDLAKAQASAARLTGCLDEQGGRQYVLLDPADMHLVSMLEPDGFETQSFAKYMGQKVTVTGSRTSKDGTTLMRVRTITMVSETCTPSGSGTTPAPEKAPPPAQSPKAGTASGCLDEQAGPQYVLRGETELKLLMFLEPDGFPAENFARYLGHRVEVSGSTAVQGQKTVMKVKTIKSVAEHCTPQ